MKTFIRISAIVMALALMCALAASFSAYSFEGLMGDADNDGKVTVMDATCIQRTLAGLCEDADGMTELLGDTNSDGLNIMDATRIQRWLADFAVDHPVGVYCTFELPDPTQAPTQAPTKPSYELPPV